MKRTWISILFIVITGIFISSLIVYFWPVKDITVTLSSVVDHADINDSTENYDYYSYYNLDHYDENYSYEQDSGYNVYNCYLKVDNNSDYDIYNVYINDSLLQSKKLYHIDKYDKFDSYIIQSGESAYIAFTISIKNDLTQGEIRDIINNLNGYVTVCLVNPQEEKPIKYNRKIIIKCGRTDKSYLNEDICYPNLL